MFLDLLVMLYFTILQFFYKILCLFRARMVNTVKILLKVLIFEGINFVPQFLFEAFLVELLPETANFIFDFPLFELNKSNLVPILKLPHLPFIPGDDLNKWGGYSIVHVDIIAMDVLLDHVMGLHYGLVDFLNGDRITSFM